MRSVLTALAAAGLLVLAFPPFAVGILAVAGVALFLAGLRRGRHPVLAGLLFGLAFFSGLIWWVGELGLIAVAPLVIVFGLYLALYGWLLGKARDWPVNLWWLAAVGGWGVMEAARVRFPVGGFEWGLVGYTVSPLSSLRNAAQWIGTSGWSIVLVAMAAGLVVAFEQKRLRLELLGPVAVAGVLVAAGALWPPHPEGPPIRVAIVQGSTPCPLTHCLNERRATYEQHLALTRSIPAGSVDLVVWPEGSTGGFDADPVLNPDVASAMGKEAERLGAYLLAGGDRPLSDTHWLNANVLFAPDGSVVGEYRKRHPVPFGEYIPARPLFEWIPALDQVPRDLIRGDGPLAFDLPVGRVGSVISFEAAFARYSRDEVRIGAQLLVVASNEGSYEFTPVSDQFIAMTRMRAAELGVDLVHSAVTGRSTFIKNGAVGEMTQFLDERFITATLTLREGPLTLYARWGEWLQAAGGGGLAAALFLRRRGETRPAV
ncbi:MAG TPA: apolipoprotein N-acyltransferase [Acidimicrobiia bacterium]|nr:apolipoprotein N-acyltransferase [Acidimicrobiia bacterium]